MFVSAKTSVYNSAERRSGRPVEVKPITPVQATESVESVESVELVAQGEVVAEAAPEPVSPEPTLAPEQSPESSPEQLAQREYLEAKRTFKAAESTYLHALDVDFERRNGLKKFFGFGRADLSPEVQAAYDSFMVANKRCYELGHSSGLYDKIAARLNRDQSEAERESIKPMVADRHVLTPAALRLEVQTMQLPESLQTIKAEIMQAVRDNPKKAVVIGATLTGIGLLFNTPAVIAALGTRFVGARFVKKIDANRERVIDDTIEKMGGDIDFAALESEYFRVVRDVQDAKKALTGATVGAAVAAGGMDFSASAPLDPAGGVPTHGFDFSDVTEVASMPSAEAPPPADLMDAEVFMSDGSSEVVAEPALGQQSAALSPEAHQAVPAPELGSAAVPEQFVTPEKYFVPRSGDRLSEALLHEIKEQMAAKAITLPTGVTPDDISHYMYQSFPELTGAHDVSPRLTSEQWMELGISSGDPQAIKIGEQINIQGILNEIAAPSGAPTTDALPMNIAEVPPVAPEHLASAATPPVPSVPESVPVVAGPETTLATSGSLVAPAHAADRIILQTGETNLMRVAQELERWQAAKLITLPDNLTVDGTTYSGNLAGYLEARFPELSASAATWWRQPTLTPEQWQLLGVADGKPSGMATDDILEVGKFFQILAGAKPEEVLPSNLLTS